MNNSSFFGPCLIELVYAWRATRLKECIILLYSRCFLMFKDVLVFHLYITNLCFNSCMLFCGPFSCLVGSCLCVPGRWITEIKQYPPTLKLTHTEIVHTRAHLLFHSQLLGELFSNIAYFVICCR